MGMLTPKLGQEWVCTVLILKVVGKRHKPHLVTILYEAIRSKGKL